MIAVILHEPEVAGNVGAVARLMSNFGVKDLVVINPKCAVNSIEAEGRAKHARFILKNVRMTTEEVLGSFDTLVGTTGRVGTDFNIPRSPLTPKQAAEIVAPLVNKKHRVGLLFGNEGTGLSNRILEQCDFTMTIPSDKKYQTLNLSHAVGIVLYELFVLQEQNHTTSHFRFATGHERKALLSKINECIDAVQWSGVPSRKETQKLIWKRLISKSFLTKREIFGLFGFFRRIKNK